MEDGQFDGLEGKGKPLNLDNNPHEDPAWRLANHVLKNSGFSLPWIQTRQEIVTEIDALLASLKRAWEWRLEALEHKQPLDLVEDEWRRATVRFEQSVEKLNKRIRIYNLEVPSERFQLMVINATREIEKVQAKNS
jgi:DnaJ family protein C protein 28